jgi:dTDP-4-amino-4,6-dideoxygalactose transaminase
MGVYNSFADLENKKWKKGDWIYINKLFWGKNEIDKIREVLEGDWFGGNSKFNTDFENKIKAFSGFNFFQTLVVLV